MALSTKHNQINNSLFHIVILTRTKNLLTIINKKILFDQHHKPMLLRLQIKRVAVVGAQGQRRNEVYFQNNKLSFQVSQLIALIQIKDIKYLIKEIKPIKSIVKINKNQILNFHPIHFSVVQHKLLKIQVNWGQLMQQDLILVKKVIKIRQILI